MRTRPPHAQRQRPLRILLLTQWFDPEPTFKGLPFARELARRGHEVQVLTGFPNYPGGRLYPGWRQRPLHRSSVDGITVTRVPLHPSHDGSALHRAMTYGSFALTATLGALTIERPDVVYLYHPPATVGLAALALKHLRGVPFVTDVQDLWPDALAGTAMVRSPLLLRAVGALVHRVLAASDHIVTLSQGTTRIIAERTGRPLAVTTVPNWADETALALRPTEARPAPADADGDRTRPFTVTFAGNIGPFQGLDSLLDAAALLRDRPDIRIRVVGDGLEAPRLQRRAADEHLTSVEFAGRVPMTDMGPVLADADVLLVHLSDDPSLRVAVPSKTQAYLHAGKPVLMVAVGDAADLVHLSGAGTCVPPGDPQALARAILRLSATPREELLAQGRAGQDFYDRTLSLARGTDRFEAILRRTATTRPRVDAVKRAADVVAAAIGLVAATPVILATAALVACRLGRPVLFRQERLGRDGRPFALLKFRTMTDARGPDGMLLADHERLGRLGEFLRTTSIDELPGLVNVLRGDLSLIGPRPLLPRYLPWYDESELERFRVRPGMSGLAQVRGRNTLSWDDRLASDVEYVRAPSLLTDLKLVVATLRALVRRTGAIADPRSLMADLDEERRERGEQPPLLGST